MIKRFFNKAITVYILFVTVFALLSSVSLRAHKDEVLRLRENQRELLEENATWRTENGQAAARIQVLELSLKEYRTAIDERDGLLSSQREALEQLNVELRRVKSTMETGLQLKVDTVVSLVTPVTEVAKVADVEIVRWSDSWVDLLVSSTKEGAAHVELQARDTLVQVAWRVPKRFLGIPYGTKYIAQEIISSNPHSKVVYSRIINIVKK